MSEEYENQFYLACPKPVHYLQCYGEVKFAFFLVGRSFFFIRATASTFQEGSMHTEMSITVPPCEEDASNRYIFSEVRSRFLSLQIFSSQYAIVDNFAIFESQWREDV